MKEELLSLTLLPSVCFLVYFQVDCTEAGKGTCSRFGVTGYPTLKIFKFDNFVQDYNGPREAHGIAKYMRAQVGPASKLLDSLGALEQFLADRDTSIVGYFKDANSPLAKLFMQYADMQREKYRFGHTYAPEVLESDGEK